MKEMNNECSIEKQVCFQLYACSRESIKLYKTYLDPFDLTYTQYIVMMVLWEKKAVTVKELGRALYLDSGTLTPLLKKLEAKGLVNRKRSEEDERNLIVSITDEGVALRDAVGDVPQKVFGRIALTKEESMQLSKLLGKILAAD